jgi:glycosyltransferase involved in cell wall biosynthesis
MSRDAEPIPQRTLFLLSPSRAPCGVESFARLVAAHWPQAGEEADTLPVSGRLGDILAIWTALSEVEALIVNVPVVAWKKVLLTPLVALILAAVRGRASLLVLHEWADLDWRRRLVIGAYAFFAQRLVFSSPHVRAGFLRNGALRLLRKPTAIVPIPSNIPPVESSAEPRFAARLREARAQGRLVIGHFGSIYPRKQSDFVLDVAEHVARRGRPVLSLFIGDFIKGMDRVEEEFTAKVRRLGMEENVLVTGYVADFGEMRALFRAADCFLYRFPEGLTSRRGSVLACLQSGRPVIVNAPRDAGEFDHHRAYRRSLDGGVLRLLDHAAGADDYAEALATIGAEDLDASRAAQHYEECWRDAAAALVASLEPEKRRRDSVAVDA